MPWGQILQSAHRMFGLLPAQFWALSVYEWRALQAPQSGYADRRSLGNLMGQYPDKPEEVK